MTQSNTNRLLGIADPSWPTTSLIEKRAIELGYEAVVTSTPGNLESQASEFGMVVVHLPNGGSIQSIIESIKLFDDEIQFIVLTDRSDQQSVKTLERIPGVSVFCVSTIDAISWNELFAQHLERSSGSTKEEQPTSDAQYVFVDPKSQHLLALVERLATTKAYKQATI